MNIYDKSVNDSTMGYRVKGYYADDEMGEWTHTKMDDGRRKMDDGRSKMADGRWKMEIFSHQP